MNNSKNNKTDNQINIDMIKRPSIPLIVGTGAILFASVMSCDISTDTQLKLLDNNIIYTQNTQAAVKSQEDGTISKKKTSSNKRSSYFRNEAGELFYDSDAEDDAEYYGDWDIDPNYDDDDDMFILW